MIQVEHLSKRYQLGHAPEKYHSFRDALTQGARSLKRRVLHPRQRPTQTEDFWALQDVSFSVAEGDRVAIIGRNGAGKSTLLKILSRITEPTSGRISMGGRVASLLEVGTGFHPELTGRENIFLNGAILGMSRGEIRRKFDEIVAFAEVEKFLDTPVKRYSSGMYVRLAFAVAAHLEPEILIVDEVLAVGDAQFQNKCLGKMQDVAHSGRTVLFVSHNMAAVRQLCTTALWMQQGQLVQAGPVEAIANQYLRSTQSGTRRTGDVSPYGLALADIRFEDQDSIATHALTFNQDYTLKLHLSAQSPLSDCGVVVKLYDGVGTLISSLCTTEEGIHPFPMKGEQEITFELPQLALYPGSYYVSVFVYRSNDPTAYLEVENALSFEIHGAILKDAMWPYRSDHGVARVSQAAHLHRLSSSTSFFDISGRSTN